ncbi:MAG: DUF3786 domain-containing protein [Armatimonadota bacterium]
MAVERLATAKPEELAARCGAVYDGSFRVRYLGREYEIAWPSGRVEASLPVQVLLLLYVLDAHKMPGGELIAYRDIPGAATYEPSFEKRAMQPLIRAFGEKPELLYAVAEGLGGERAPVADVGIKLPVLPLLPVTYGIWSGDDEFPASGTILFDSSARRMLSAECLIVAASNGVYEMMRSLREMENK